MRPAPDTIPVRVAPVPGEAVDSWLEAWAYRLRCAVHELCSTAQIAVPGRFWLSGTAQTVPERFAGQFQALSAISGVGVALVAAMTKIPGLAAAGDGGPQSGPDRWPRLLGSRFCPACLTENDGRWPLTWRSPWTFACIRHGVLLLDACPACFKTPRHGWSFPKYWPWPVTACRSRVDAERRAQPSAPRATELLTASVLTRWCGYDLSAAPVLALPSGGPVLAAQARVWSLLGDGASDGHWAWRELGDLFAAACSVLRALSRGGADDLPEAAEAVQADLGGFRPVAPATPSGRRSLRPDVGTMAFALSIAAVVRPQHVPHSGHHGNGPDAKVIAWLARHEIGDVARAGPGPVVARWHTATTETQAAILAGIGPRLRPSDRLRYRTSTTTPRRPVPDLTARRAALVPALFWRGWALRLNPGRFNPLPFRETLTTMLLLAGSDDDLTCAYTAIGRTPPAKAANAASWRAHNLARTGHLDAVIAIVARLADALDTHGAPIDHARRRQVFTNAQPDWDLLHERFDDLGIRRPNDSERQHYQWRVIEMLTGNLPYYTPDPAAGRLPGYAGRTYEDAVARYRPAIAAHLHHQAALLLDRAGIDEPVTWEPPIHWLGDDPPDLPGPEPDDIDIVRMRALLRTPSRPSDVARKLDTSLEHVRTAAARHAGTASDAEIAEDLSGYRNAGRQKIARTALPDAEQLRAARDAGQTIKDIARATGHSANTLHTAASRHGIAFPPWQAYRIDPDWLQDQITNRHRTYAEIAEQLGISAVQLGALAKKAGITAQPRGGHGHRHPLAAHGGPAAHPPAVWAALAGQKPLPRARHFLAVADHPTLSATAEALGIRITTLISQLNKIERDTGLELFQRSSSTHRRTPTYTPAGQRLAEQLRAVLETIGRPRQEDGLHHTAASSVVGFTRMRPSPDTGASQR